MNRSLSTLRLTVLVAALASVGCQTLKSRQKDGDDFDSVYKSTSTSDPDLEKPDELKNFFKSGGRTGGWSKEAREIESDFGYGT